MGIRGIYRELGPGKRVSLSKLAAESLETADRPFRLAIDIAIWQFQTQAARGGTNPAIRTLFYRLVRLLGTPIQPIFVFDGPNKPKFKRNKRSGRGDGVATAQAKRLIQLFGFTTHDAPGEAEAECAFLQKNGIVDAVLSEDVDTIMFGCTKTLRNWSAEGKSSKSPTHVSMYDVEDMNLASLGLDREGMVLVALMSGGDYHPEGVPGCGVKASDTEAIRLWRESLLHELRTNEKGYFRTRHKALTIPDDFPSIEILRYYTHPVVSQGASLAIIKQKFDQKKDVHLEALREFTRETFDWDFREGAIKFIRVLGQALLVNKLEQRENGCENLVKKISGRRNHFSTDGISEIRLAYIPEEIVPIDLSKEIEEDTSYGRDGLALNSDDEFDAPASSAGAVDCSQAGTSKVFDVTKPDLAWVLEDIARKSIPEAFQAWEEAQQAKARPKPSKQKAAGTKNKKTGSAPQSALDGFMRITKTSKPTEVVSDKSVKKKVPYQPREISPSPKPSIFRRPKTPPRLRESMPEPVRDPSKQSSPTVVNDSAHPASWSTSSSPMTPRPRLHAEAEAIVIPSSPSDVASSPAPSPPASPTRVVRPSSREQSGSIQSEQAKLRRGKKSGAIQSKEVQFREVSFLGYGDISTPSDSDAITPPTKCRQNKPPKDRRTQTESAKSSSPRPLGRKKKLLVPSDAGFFDEIEVNEDEYEERLAKESRLLQSRGIKSGVARWSDVSVIDLTGEP
ncbi:Flap endonuclease GEN-like-like protein [Cladobotryum mycophilum]|uniref:Flap endonuclease GEN-like-like protein n=1 Tax=Cladobotryum mycophilum TaxID=491253 RepID=A0ABR0SA88_9HYPO